MKCYIDMDGVICACNKALCEVHGIDPRQMTKGQFQLYHLVEHRMSKKEFFAPCEEDFWANMEWEEGGRKILLWLFQFFGEENCCFLTSPTQNRGCYIGKRRWIEREVGKEWGRKMAVINEKHMFAHPGAVLIDDKDSNIDNFRKAGGHGVLVRRNWNRGHEDADETVMFVAADTITVGEHKDNPKGYKLDV